MDAASLKQLQEPLKTKYKEDPDAALITLKAKSRIGEGITCKVETGKAMVEAGLHPATGGSGISACSGDMLLEALTACAGVTLKAVATSIGFDLREHTSYLSRCVAARRIRNSHRTGAGDYDPSRSPLSSSSLGLTRTREVTFKDSHPIMWELR